MNFQVVITQIISLFLLIAVGYFLRRSKHLDQKETGAISKLLLDLILPAMLISSLQINITAKMLGDFFDLFLYWIAFYLILIVLASIITKFFPISKDKKLVLKFFLIFGNVGYMGLPVIDVIFPENGIFFGSIGVVVFNIFLWTYGTSLFLRDNQNKKINLRDIFNNGVIAIIIGLFLMLTGLKLPTAVMTAVDMLAEATFPLSMLVIGSGLAQIKISGIFKDLNIIAYSTLKLLLIPAAALLILNFFNIEDPIRTILVLQIAMPAAANGVIFAERYEGNYIFAAESLFLSTLMAALSIPLISFLTTYFK
ncbi:AEC family transporter [Halanaerobium saccharolyticum]|uniref:AEC family transporter n=1 Tax=Halanaerobium saccharolyticum TaxID=43595 RepID=UPI003FCE0A9E